MRTRTHTLACTMLVHVSVRGGALGQNQSHNALCSYPEEGVDLPHALGEQLNASGWGEEPGATSILFIL